MSRRTERLNDQLREEISDLVQHQLKDPGIAGLVGIVEVDVAPDLSHARVFVSVLGSEEERASTMRALGKSAGFLRRELLRRLRIRRIPELAFLPDDSIERGARILSLLDETHEP
jgi:ribosome-binding factor A